jgi:hypothetical protein
VGSIALAILGIADAVVWSPPIPDRSLWQLDLLYLDEPAPLADELGLGGEATLLVVCDDCDASAVEELTAYETLLTDDPDVARAYGLLRTNGVIGPGYAIIDADARVRYRTFDPGLVDHAQEIGILLGALR